MKYNDPNYHTINYSNYSLKELYEERINIINNKYNYNPKSLYKLVDFIESEILKHEKGMILLVNLQIIAENRRHLEYNYCSKEQHYYLFSKLLESAHNCETLLDLEKDSIITREEKIYKNCLNILHFMGEFTNNIINEFKEYILLCGCNKSIK
jgi:hypothetical protein